jgi:glycine hydroxymethyltransferase
MGGGSRVSRRLEEANILATGIPLPVEPIAGDYAGLRIGTQEVTRLGMRPAEMVRIARFMARHLVHGEPASAVGREVAAFRDAFRTVGYCTSA